jgi:hypothetical protein
VNGKVYAEIQGYVYWLEPNSSLLPQTIAFNSFQRLCASIQENDQVAITILSEDKLGPLLGVCKLTVDVYPPNKGAPVLEIEGEQVEQIIRESFQNHVFSRGQYFPIQFETTGGVKIILKCTVTGLGAIAIGEMINGAKNGTAPSTTGERRGVLSPQTEIDVASGDSGSTRVQSNKPHSRNIFPTRF